MRPPAATSRMIVRVRPQSVPAALGCGAGCRPLGFPAYSPANAAPQRPIAGGPQTPAVRTRNPHRDSSRIAGGTVVPLQIHRGQGQGAPLSRPICSLPGGCRGRPCTASDSAEQAGALVAQTRQPSRPIAVATAWRSTTAFTPRSCSTCTVTVDRQSVAAGACTRSVYALPAVPALGTAPDSFHRGLQRGPLGTPPLASGSGHGARPPRPAPWPTGRAAPFPGVARWRGARPAAVRSRRARCRPLAVRGSGRS